jgi:hypothetical protein
MAALYQKTGKEKCLAEGLNFGFPLVPVSASR